MRALAHKASVGMPRKPARARRDRRSSAARSPVLHVVMPGCEVGREIPRPRETISAFLRRTGWAKRDRQFGWQFRRGLPTILEINGEPVLRKLWARRRIAANDNVRFVSRPLGGGGRAGTKQVLGMVALVAISAFAFWAGPALFTAGSFGAYATTAAIGLGGALLVNALTGPKAGATNDPSAKTDQIYSVQAQGNVPKLGQPLPVPYGRLQRYPDFAATPWSEFVGNDQYINILLAQGLGSYAYESMTISDTLFWTVEQGVQPAFSSALVSLYEPGQVVDLFPINVAQSDEVNGQQLPHGAGWDLSQDVFTPGNWLGGFVAAAPGTVTTDIAVDFVFPAGCFATDKDNGNTVGIRTGLEAQYRLVNDAGAPLGDWQFLFSITREYANRSPIRDGVKTAVPPGRYEVRLRRSNGVPPDDRGASEIVWAGLRAFLQGNNSFTDISTVAIRIKATETTQGSYKFGTLATRKLPVWHADAGAFVLEPSRSPAWAFLDAATNASYGAGLSLAKVDFNTIVNFAAGCAARGDTFDYAFTAAVAVPDAFDRILTVTRSRHFWLGDTISVVRDEWQDVPSMLLTDREIVRDSTQITFTMLGEDDPDAVVIEYVDENTWRPAQVQYPPDGQFFTATNSEVKRIDGIVNREQAYREAAFYYLQSIYRRENVQISVEYEGRALTFGQTIRVQSELPMAYGQGGAVVDHAAAALTVQPAPSWAAAGPYFIRLRRANGKWFGPLAAYRGATDANVVLDPADLANVVATQGITLAAALAREDGGEDPSFELGTADNQSRVVKLLSGVPNGNTSTLNLVVDDIRVHATDLGAPPALPTAAFPVNPTVPLIIGLTGIFGQGTAEPRLSASWFPTAGALYYVADVSYDDGASWQQVYEGQDNKFTATVMLAQLTLRVQAVAGATRGPYAAIDLDAPTIVIAPGTVALTSVVAGIRDQVTKIFNNQAEETAAALKDIAKLVQQALSGLSLDKQQSKTQLSAIADNALAKIDDVRTVAVTANDAVADLSTTISAQFLDVYSNIQINATSIATLSGYAASRYSVTLDVNGYATGFTLINAGGGVSSTTFLTTNFQIAAVGPGGGAVPIFQTAFVNGVPKIALKADVIADHSILAGHMSVATLDAITANFGTMTAGRIQSVSGKMVIDLDNERELFSD